MSVEDIIANMVFNDLKYGSHQARIRININCQTLDMDMETENIHSLKLLISYLQYCVIENLKAAGVKEEEAKEAFNIEQIISQAYAQPKYLKLNGKNFREENK